MLLHIEYNFYPTPPSSAGYQRSQDQERADVGWGSVLNRFKCDKNGYFSTATTATFGNFGGGRPIVKIAAKSAGHPPKRPYFRQNRQVTLPTLPLFSPIDFAQGDHNEIAQ